MKHYTEDEIETIASRAMSDPASLNLDEIEALGASRLRLVRRNREPSLAALAPPGAHAHYNGLNALLRPYEGAQGKTPLEAFQEVLDEGLKPYRGPSLLDVVLPPDKGR